MRGIWYQDRSKPSIDTILLIKEKHATNGLTRSTIGLNRAREKSSGAKASSCALSAFSPAARQRPSRRVVMIVFVPATGLVTRIID